MDIQLGKTQITTECTWGDGPDVSMGIHCDQELSRKFMGNYYPISLTAEQATSLARQLLNAASQARELETIAEQQDANTP